MSFGLTPQGFVRKTLPEIRAELEAQLRADFGAGINLGTDSVFGRLVGISAEREALLWELAEAVYKAFDPDAAGDAQLDALCALTGTFRQPASQGTATLTATGAPGTGLPVGRVVSSALTGSRWATQEAATLAAVPSWVGSTAYALGARVTNGGRVYQALQAGLSAPSGGPSGAGNSIADGAVLWRHIGQGTAAVDVPLRAEQTGPLAAPSGALTTIETPVGGWQGALNLLDASPGTDVEKDPALRLRREAELSASEGGPVDAIREHVSAVESVSTVLVFQNTTLVVDGNGLPPKSVEVLVLGGDEDEVRRTVFESVAAGIETFGNQPGTVTDSAGVAHPVAFSRPTEKEVFVTVEYDFDPATFPADGDDQVRAAVLGFGKSLPIGRDVTASAVSAQAFKVVGVLDVTAVFLGLAVNPLTSAAIVNNARELAVFDSSRLVTVPSVGVP